MGQRPDIAAWPTRQAEGKTIRRWEGLKRAVSRDPTALAVIVRRRMARQPT